MELENKARFWVGVALVVPEFLGLVIFGLTLVDWSFMSVGVLLVVGAILYNVLAGILIWTGSRKVSIFKKKDKKK